MSSAFDRGRNTEREVASILRKKLGVRVERDRQSGAGLNKADISDYYRQLPLHIECKDQETLKVKEWMRQTMDDAGFPQAPTLVFRMDAELIACLPLTNLVDFLIEIADLRAEIADLRQPIVTAHVGVDLAKEGTDKTVKHVVKLGEAIAKQMESGTKTCKNGHLVDQFNYCLQPGCKFSRGYRAPKGKK